MAARSKSYWKSPGFLTAVVIGVPAFVYWWYSRHIGAKRGSGSDAPGVVVTTTPMHPLPMPAPAPEQYTLRARGKSNRGWFEFVGMVRLAPFNRRFESLASAQSALPAACDVLRSTLTPHDRRELVALEVRVYKFVGGGDTQVFKACPL